MDYGIGIPSYIDAWQEVQASTNLAKPGCCGGANAPEPWVLVLHADSGFDRGATPCRMH